MTSLESGFSMVDSQEWWDRSMIIAEHDCVLPLPVAYHVWLAIEREVLLIAT